MVFRHAYRGGVWVDIEKPTAEDVRAVVKEFDIPQHIERELLAPTPFPLVIGHDTMSLMVLHYPSPNDEGGATQQEVDFVVGKTFILTVRYELMAPIHHLEKLIEAQQLVEGKALVTTEMLLEILFAHLYDAMRDHTNAVADKLSHVEHDMFAGKERHTIRTISSLSRSFLHLESALANHEDSMEHFLETLIRNKLFTAAFAERARRILAERTHLSRIVRAHRATGTELRETNIALLESKQNEIMKTLTIINFIFLPLGLISWVFAMRTEGMPIINSPHAFWIVLAGMLGTAVLLLGIFIKKRWFL